MLAELWMQNRSDQSKSTGDQEKIFENFGLESEPNEKQTAKNWVSWAG